MSLRTAALGALFLASGLCVAAPDCLIVQIQKPLESGSDPNYSLAPFVAEELDKDGRVRPVVWSMTDPVFREWMSKDVVSGFEPNPTTKTAMDMARKLGVRFLLVIQGFREGQSAFAIGELFDSGRNIWRFGPRKPDRKNDIVIQANGKYDEKATREFQARMPDIIKSGGTFTVYQNGVPDFIDTARSVASTWTALLGDGPLKSLPQKPRMADPGTTSKTTLDPADLVGPGGSDSQEVLAQVHTLVESGHFHKALLLLREATDRRPFEIEIRMSLVETLLAAGMANEAAEAAQAATRIEPKNPELWIVAARGWVGASNPDNALEALRAALANGAKGDSVLELQGDIALLQGDPRAALESFSKIKGGRATVRSAVAMALTGDSDGCRAALKAMGEGPMNEVDYRSLVLFIDQGLVKLGEASRAVIPMIKLHPGEPQTLKTAKDFASRANALSTLVSVAVPSVIHKESHEARKLAHILLAQASLEALGFAESNDPDLAEEAAASLGQAFRLFPGVREKFGLERKYGL